MVFTKIFLEICFLVHAVVRGIWKHEQTNVQGVMLMTSNQIAYIQAMESQRHNVAQETEIKRSNLANEEIGWKNAESSERSSYGSLFGGITGFIF